MYIYSSTNLNHTSALLRLATTMRQAKENKRRFVVFIGAGCSLSSSKSDISTSALIERCLKDSLGSDYTAPDSWEGLYRDFVNQIWEVYGKSDRQEILSKYFIDATPAKGYLNLRKLVEFGFVTDIVTTNFDMLIDEAFHGLSYSVQVGDLQPRQIKGGSNIKLYKVHGDIESGELRFSPKELRDLPLKIHQRVKEVSENSCVFCGYSGQDQGLMKSLDIESGYAVYWASPKKPLKDDIYGTQNIYDWLHSRKSENNFIFGDELGKFDGLMEALVCTLVEGKEITNCSNWEYNTIGNTLQINKRVFSIFQQLINCSTILRQQYEWTPKFPFYSKDYETTLNAYLYYYSDNSNLPPTLLQIPENEIEALIMGLAIEVLASISGIVLLSEEYAHRLRELFEKGNPKYAPDDSFWSALKAILLSIENQSPLLQDEGLLDISLKMNSNGRMTLSVREPKLNYVAETISLLSISGLFIPTCEIENNLDQYKEAKILIEKHGKQALMKDGKLCFYLKSISQSEFRDIYQLFFSQLDGYSFCDKNTILGPRVQIIADIKETEQHQPINSLSESIYYIAKNSTKAFIELKSAFEIDNEEYISSSLDDVLREFINSSKLGAFIIGSSGSGKTKSIQNFIKSNLFDNFLIAVASPKTMSFDNDYGISVFWESLQFDNEIQLFNEIDVFLSTRNKKLILIIDGLNEIDGGLENCIKHYKSIIKTLDQFTSNNIKSIKVIITCRDHAFLDYCEIAGVYPSTDVCYCSLQNDHISPYYQIQPLTLEKQLEYINLYFSDTEKGKRFAADIKTNRNLRHSFNQPYLLAVAGKYYSLSDKNNEISSLQETFKLYTEQMLKRLGDYTIIALARDIIQTYFDLVIGGSNFGRRITQYVLLNKISGNEYNKVSKVLRSLCDINIFTDNHSEDYIKFTHDRIEEYFLCEYLFAKASNPTILIRFFEITKIDPIFYSAAIEYFRKLARQKLFNQIIESYSLLYNHCLDQLPCIIISCLASLSYDMIKQFFFVAENSDIDLDTFILFIFNGLKQAIYRNDIPYPEVLIVHYDELYPIFPHLNKYRKYFFYIASRYYLIQKGNFNSAEIYCDLALSCKSNDEYLNHLVYFQKAVLQKHKSLLDNAISSLSDLFEYFSINQRWESATDCVLEWGSALREKTRFSDALTVYERIDINSLSTMPAMQTKLHRKKGTIHKNLMQQLISNYIDDTTESKIILQEINKCFYDAQKEYELAKNRMSNSIDMIEKMIIISEQAEICLKYSVIEPEQLYRAELYLFELEKLLAIFPVPDTKIVYLRLKAKYEEKKGNYINAIETLINTHELATLNAKDFRVFEVNYQLGRMIERYKEKLPHSYLHIGLDALDAATNTGLNRDNQYIINCTKSKKRLETFIQNSI